MHTLDIPNARARIFHNGDWSGDVEVLLGVNPIGHPDQDAPPSVRLRIPAAVFAAVAVKMLEEALQDVRSPTKAVMLYHEPPRDPYALAYTGLWCAVCGEPQFNTPSGVTCANRHGGADGVEPAGDTR